MLHPNRTRKKKVLGVTTNLQIGEVGPPHRKAGGEASHDQGVTRQREREDPLDLDLKVMTGMIIGKLHVSIFDHFSGLYKDTQLILHTKKLNAKC